MTNYWNKKTIPHKGWINQGHEDLEEATHVCDMCGKEEIRYVHEMYHPEVDRYFRVGQICASKMTNDYNTPKQQLKQMKSKTNWMSRNWKKDSQYDYQSKSFNSVFGRVEIGIFKVNNSYKCHDGDTIYAATFDTVEKAKHFVYDVYKD